jgi:hypothetical protein
VTDYEAAVEVREALVTVAEQLEELSSVTERVDALNDTLTRIAVALEQLVLQHGAASIAQHGATYLAALETARRGDEPA